MKVYRLMEDKSGLLILQERVFLVFWKTVLKTYLPRAMRDFISFLDLEYDAGTGNYFQKGQPIV